MASSAKVRKQAKRLKGHKVCITLHDGRSYVGWITGLEKEALILSHPPAPRKPQRSRKPGRTPSRQHFRQQKAEVSAFMPLLGSLLGGGGGGAALGGLAGGGAGGFGGLLGGGLRLFGIVQKAMPVMKMGYGMIKQIKPFMEGLKGLMGR
ncbi:hypothetical protein C2I18_13110 [Paenibacillus sp. PK3_47]|uniref:LSm family protein n=1 Tax=Paenibacillus sp. PK3_47 TaxID=2072642 RepID=UPI00201E653D|nr:LSm family protein [Paenibacillus sp. PK3_47]UQZ34374.1 hypothetical protein C2I18_13110 [Paenibacillus sp. PK3_47]